MEKEKTLEKKILSLWGGKKEEKDKEHSGAENLSEDEFQKRLASLRKKYSGLLSENTALREKIEELEGLIGSLLRSLIVLAAQDDHIEIRSKLLELQESMRQGVNISEMKRIGSELRDLILKIEPRVTSDDAGRTDVEYTYVKKLLSKLEQSYQNVLLLLSRDISILVKATDEKLAKKSQKFVRYLETRFSAEVVEKVTYQFNILYEEYRQAVREEREKLEDLLKTIMTNLVETQEEFLRSISENHEWLERTSKDHNSSMIKQTEQIEEICTRSVHIGELKENLLGRINEIKKLIQIKRDLDQKQIDNYIKEELKLRRQLREAKQQKKSYFEELLAVREKALEDPLTGVYNREAYRIRIQEVLNSDKKFVLMILDIDDFKEINDKWGHKVGDDVLQRTMYYVKKKIRTTDMLARYGGDEFVIILENADLDDGVKKAQEILKSISRVEFHLTKDSKHILKIGMSIGVAERREDDTAESLFERADRAMYVAKMNGKNQCCSERDL